jgi:tetratricopeptide (TPR) repeat protein
MDHPADHPRIPVWIVHGPLGSGKTDLVGQLWERLRTRSGDAGPEAVVLSGSSTPIELDVALLPGRVEPLDAPTGCGCSAEPTAIARRLDALAGLVERPVLLMELDPSFEARAIAAGLVALGRHAPRLVDLAGSPTEPLPGVLVLDPAAALALAGSPDPLVAAPGPPGPAAGPGRAPGCACASPEIDPGPRWAPFFHPGPVDPRQVEAALDGDGSWVRVKGLGHVAGSPATPFVLVRSRAPSGLAALAPPAADDLSDRIAEHLPWLAGGTLIGVWAPGGAPEADPRWELALHRRLAVALPGVPATPAALDAQAARRLASGELLDALAAARQAAALEPTASRFETLAKGYHRFGANGRAFAWIRAALALDPDHRSARLNAVRLHLAVGDHDEGEALLAPLLGPGIEDVEAWLLRARLALARGEHAQAAALLEARWSLADPPEAALAELVAACEGLGDLDRALAHQEELLRRTPDDEGGWYHLGELQVRRGHIDEALVSLERARALGNETSWCLLLLGLARLERGEPEVAAEHLRTADRLAQELLSEHPDDPSFRLDAALAAVACGGRSRAEVESLLPPREAIDAGQAAWATELLARLVGPEPRAWVQAWLEPAPAPDGDGGY